MFNEAYFTIFFTWHTFYLPFDPYTYRCAFILHNYTLRTPSYYFGIFGARFPARWSALVHAYFMVFKCFEITGLVMTNVYTIYTRILQHHYMVWRWRYSAHMQLLFIIPEKPKRARRIRIIMILEYRIIYLQVGNIIFRHIYIIYIGMSSGRTRDC